VIYGVVLLVYFAICSVFTWLSRYLERRLNPGTRPVITTSTESIAS